LQPHATRVASSAVRATGFRAIGKRVPTADAGDVAPGAFLRLLMLPALPEAEDELLGLSVAIVLAPGRPTYGNF
jgi:hypothetical protein